MDKNKQILETLKMQPLSEEEKAARHILGRLYGPIATCTENTRNGRRYNKDLWEKALKDDIFQEKIANKSLFLELGHPADREETDMTCVCACIPEMPKIVDGDLYAYVDILDTDNGRLLKTLCDYGFVPGISSRGSGDIMENDEVDPETFFLETWDIVQLPAVKKARLQVCESLNTEELQLKKALTESFNKADKDGKQAMKAALENLKLDVLDESTLKEADTLPGGTPTDAALIPESQLELEEKVNAPLNEDEEDAEIGAEEMADEEAAEPAEPAEDAEKPTEEPAKEPEAEAEEAEAKAEETAEEAAKEEDEAAGPTPLSDHNMTAGELASILSGYDADREVNISLITIGDQEYAPDMSFDDSEEGKLKIDITCTPVESNDNKEEADAEEAAEEKADETDEEAVDDGDDEVIESLKEALRQKAALEKEVKELRNQKTVSDAEVKGLQESLTKYKTAFARTSELASKSVALEKEVASLNEQANKDRSTIQALKETAAKVSKLTESTQRDSAKVKTLTENLAKMQAEAKDSEKALNEQIAQYKQKLVERTALAKQYKAKAVAVLERYIASKASMLGVRPTDITSRLSEGYSMDDIDKVCDDLLEINVNMTKLPFGVDRSRTKVVESKAQPKTPEDGYELDDSLFELAGLDQRDF